MVFAIGCRISWILCGFRVCAQEFVNFLFAGLVCGSQTMLWDTWASGNCAVICRWWMLSRGFGFVRNVCCALVTSPCLLCAALGSVINSWNLSMTVSHWRLLRRVSKESQAEVPLLPIILPVTREFTIIIICEKRTLTSLLQNGL